MRILHCILLFVVAPSVAAQTRELAPFVGWQEGGALSVARRETAFNGAPVFGVVLSFDRGPDRRLDVLLAHEGTKAEREDPFEPRVSESVTIDYLHLGGRYFIRRKGLLQPYIGATIGATRIAAGDANAIRPSFSGALGAEIPISGWVALRLDGRVFTTLVEANARFACDSTGLCTTFTNGNAIYQWNATAGMVFRF
jgi:hypothetical protein